jgi:5-methylcytosine-specific restriction protein A
MLKRIVDAVQGKAPLSAKRSSKWPAARARHIKANPVCAVCGGAKKLEVHHVKPFHLHPELELDPNNFVTLCESKSFGVVCHLFCGHLGSYKTFNVDVKADAAVWKTKLATRPLSEVA